MKKIATYFFLSFLATVLSVSPLDAVYTDMCCSQTESINWSAWLGGALLGAGTGAAVAYAAKREKRGRHGKQGFSGERGPRGADGANGTNGFNGEPGDPGRPGVAGPIGPSGPQPCCGCDCEQDPFVGNNQIFLTYLPTGMNFDLIGNTTVVDAFVRDPHNRVFFIGRMEDADQTPKNFVFNPPNVEGTYEVFFEVVTGASALLIMSTLGAVTVFTNNCLGEGPFINTILTTPAQTTWVVGEIVTTSFDYID